MSNEKIKVRRENWEGHPTGEFVPLWTMRCPACPLITARRDWWECIHDALIHAGWHRG